MLRIPRLILALFMIALSPAALAQKSSGYMNLEDMSDIYGTQLAVFRVMLSATDAVCPEQTGILRIGPHGVVTDIIPILRGSRSSQDWRMEPPPDPDDFTYRRRVATESCRIDIDIGEQQKKNDEWMPLRLPASMRLNAVSDHRVDKPDDPPTLSPARAEIYERNNRARAHAGGLRQGVTATVKGFVGFEGANDCFDAVGTFLIEQNGVTLLFPTGLGGELNRFFAERVDVDAEHSTFYLSRGSCRVGFTISAATFRDGSWVPLPIEPFKPSKS
jgi:hypothetical protein